jgi:hypothetical protein
MCLNRTACILYIHIKRALGDNSLKIFIHKVENECGMKN